MQAMRVVLGLAVLLVVAPLGAQQGAPGGRGMGGDPAAMQARQNEMLFRGITLSAEQKTKVDSIQAAGNAALQGLMQGGGMRDPDTRTKIQEQRQAMMAAVRGVLTPAQQTTFDANVASMPAMGAGGRPPE
jgi:Spy/CpxP family protein refolding chaperone